MTIISSLFRHAVQVKEKENRHVVADVRAVHALRREGPRAIREFLTEETVVSHQVAFHPRIQHFLKTIRSVISIVTVAIIIIISTTNIPVTVLVPLSLCKQSICSNIHWRQWHVTGSEGVMTSAFLKLKEGGFLGRRFHGTDMLEGLQCSSLPWVWFFPH